MFLYFRSKNIIFLSIDSFISKPLRHSTHLWYMLASSFMSSSRHLLQVKHFLFSHLTRIISSMCWHTREGPEFASMRVHSFLIIFLIVQVYCWLAFNLFFLTKKGSL